MNPIHQLHVNPFQMMYVTIHDKLKEDLKEDKTLQAFPLLLDQIVDSLCKVHFYYRTFKQSQTLAKAVNTSKGHPIVYGAALQLFGDSTSIGSFAVGIALITKCTEDLLTHYRQLRTDYQSLRDSFRCQYPVYQAIEWKDKGNILSPSVDLFFRIKLMKFTNQIHNITQCALKVLWTSFKLSMCMCDAYLVLNGDSQARFDACTELVTEWNHYYCVLKDDQERLLEEVEKGSELADKIIKRMGLSDDRHSIIKKIKQKLGQVVDESQEILEDLQEVGEETLDTFYSEGKITPLHINLDDEKVIPPVIPPGRFPPWAGQNFSLIDLKSLQQTNSASQQNLLSTTLEESLKSLNWLADSINQLYKLHKVSSSVKL